MTALSSFFSELSKHPKAIMAVLAAMVVLGGVGLVLMNRQDDRAREANGALFLAQEALTKEMKALAATLQPAAPAEKAPAGKKGAEKKAETPPQKEPNPEDVAYKQLDVDKQFSEAITQFKGVIDRFPGTRAAFESRLQLGDLYFQHGDAANAVTWYESASKDATAPLQRAMAYTSLGYAQENSGKFAEAIKSYELALKQGEAMMKGDLLLAIARSYESQNDLAKARSTYDQIIAQMPSTEYAKSAQGFKAALD